MTRGWLSIAFACAFGAFIGALTALEISAQVPYGKYLWSIGALIGGILAYIAVDFWHFCRGVGNAYRKTIAWRPHRLYWRAYLAQWVHMAAIQASGFAAVGIWIFSGTYLYPAERWFTHEQILEMLYYGYLYLWPALSLTLGLVAARDDLKRKQGWNDTEYDDLLREKTIEGWKKVLYSNPISVLFIVLFGILFGAAWVITRLPRCAAILARFSAKVAVLIVRFLRNVFIYVHSERRTICFIDATIGAAIGYSFGSAIIGAIVGALIGLINYEIISVRWLRLVPASRS